MPSESDSLLTLNLTDDLQVAGEPLDGVVLLNFKELQKNPLEEVHVNFRGSVFTCVGSALSMYQLTLTFHS